ncbi:MAG: DUF3617 family protein [Deltaproteobacteria bacterium]|nr:DUF3617 family protein [Deltaproteobacteria bacterium]
MKGMLWTVAALAALLSPAAAPAAAPNMQEGLWEITSSIDMPGMPMKMPSTTMKHCYTKEDVRESRTLPEGDKNCKMTDLKQTGNKVTWKVDCKGEGSGEGEMVYKGDSYTGTIKVKAQGTTIVTRYDAKRVGACP